MLNNATLRTVDRCGGVPFEMINGLLLGIEARCCANTSQMEVTVGKFDESCDLFPEAHDSYGDIIANYVEQNRQIVSPIFYVPTLSKTLGFILVQCTTSLMFDFLNSNNVASRYVAPRSSSIRVVRKITSGHTEHSSSPVISRPTDQYLCQVLEFVIANPQRNHFISVGSLKTMEVLQEIFKRDYEVSLMRSDTQGLPLTEILEAMGKGDAVRRMTIGLNSLMTTGWRCEGTNLAISCTSLLHPNQAVQLAGRIHKDSEMCIFFKTDSTE